jgi:hypothetical protein
MNFDLNGLSPELSQEQESEDHLKCVYEDRQAFVIPQPLTTRADSNRKNLRSSQNQRFSNTLVTSRNAPFITSQTKSYDSVDSPNKLIILPGKPFYIQIPIGGKLSPCLISFAYET